MRLRECRREPSMATRDALVIGVSAGLTWFAIERTETGDRFFEWVAANPDYEVDSLILAFILAAVSVVIFAVCRCRELRAQMEARRAAEERAHGLDYHDPLTGLHNRRALREHLGALATHRSVATRTGLLMVDLDRFKTVNDLHGHLAGDRLLMQVAARLAGVMPEGGRAFRIGGDEFAITLDLTRTDDDAARVLARQIVQEMSRSFDEGGRVHHISASVGISIFPDDAQDGEALMRRADIALYRAKEGGGCGHRSFEPKMDAEIARRANIEAELREALKNEEFRPAFQPVLDLRTGATVGFELLARWPRSEGEEIGPGEFIPVAEESGLITELMLQTLAFACAEARDWDPALTIAINISPGQLADPELCGNILATLTRFGFAPRRLAVEITENALILDFDKAKTAIESFTNLGIKVGLDDFGTGYASLQHLRMLPFDKIKIDRSFILALDHDPEALKIVRAIIGLAASLELQIIAEGIENEAVALQLRDLGCTQGQGFHLGYPVPGSQVTRVLSGPRPLRWSRTGLRPPASAQHATAA